MMLLNGSLGEFFLLIFTIKETKLEGISHKRGDIQSKIRRGVVVFMII